VAWVRAAHPRARGRSRRGRERLRPRRGEAGRLVVVVHPAVVGVNRGAVVLPAAFWVQFLALLVVDVLGTLGVDSSSAATSSTTTFGAALSTSPATRARPR
jgi:hypothetical protein